MQAIVFVNRHGNELSPLNREYCPALLPVSNKSVIEYTLEDLSAAGVTQVKLVVSSHICELKALIKQGEAWGLQVDYFLSREQEDASKVLPRLALNKDESILLARGDILRSPCIQSFVEFSQQMKHSLVIAKINNLNAGLMMLPAAAPYTEALNWPLQSNSTQNQINNDTTQNQSVTQILHGECFMLSSLADYMTANQAVASAKVTGLTPPGRFYGSADKNNGFFLGAGAQTGQLQLQPAWGAIGDNSWVDDSVEMQQSVILGKNCIIDAQCRLTNCLILDNSYVGQALDVNAAIICKNQLLTPATGASITLDDNSIIALNAPVANDNKVAFSDRLSALLLFALGIILAPILLLMSLNIKQKRCVIKDKVTVNNQSYSSWRWNLNSLFFSRLPQLFLVITGKLNLFGCNPFICADTSPQQRSGSTATAKSDKPNKDSMPELLTLLTPTSKSAYGVYGPVQLLGNTMPNEEMQLIEAEFINNQQHRKYWRLIWQAMNHHGQHLDKQFNKEQI
ncbi:hypothetical protein TUM4438_44120 [Shewanella sairae]|uniref:Translation initiation factor eIF2B subunit gamma n=1 Tax=Shewanella sairae TaxID=190310 RepID=A0ABQ4PSI2_9GAMM|nr:NDP-sugar synthase [Shewanella sairae]MCL1131401.1 NDP-sugar synthase [Shewanella sairae]GIU52155.1 hypothetical protein TUM4438_44120 [Shewanella sairae]